MFSQIGHFGTGLNKRFRLMKSAVRSVGSPGEKRLLRVRCLRWAMLTVPKTTILPIISPGFAGLAMCWREYAAGRGSGALDAAVQPNEGWRRGEHWGVDTGGRCDYASYRPRRPRYILHNAGAEAVAMIRQLAKRSLPRNSWIRTGHSIQFGILRTYDAVRTGESLGESERRRSKKKGWRY